MPEIEIRFHESGFMGFYQNGKPVLGRRPDDDPLVTLEELGKLLGFQVRNGPELSYDELERDFA